MVRFLDILLSSAALLVLVPILPPFYVFLWYRQGRPVFFAQERVGRNFIIFRMYKFRTMYSGAEDESGLTKGSGDSRITPLGRILRRYKIDELPQFYNVLRGDMSIIGSRPQVSYYVSKFDNWYRAILVEKPGLISPSAICFSHEEELLDTVDDPVRFYEEELVPMKCKMDLELTRGFSTMRYLAVVFSFIFRKPIGGRNATLPKKNPG